MPSALDVLVVFRVYGMFSNVVSECCVSIAVYV